MGLIVAVERRRGCMCRGGNRDASTAANCSGVEASQLRHDGFALAVRSTYVSIRGTRDVR